MRILILFLCCMLMLPEPAPAGNPASDNGRISLWLATRELRNGNALSGDFLNYMQYLSTYDPGEFIILGLTANIRLSDAWDAGLSVYTSDDLFPNALHLTLSRKIAAGFRFTAGVQGYPLMIDRIAMYYHDKEPYMIASDPNFMYRQRYVYDAGVFLGPGISLSLWRFWMEATACIGYGSFLPFNEGFSHKQINSNYRREIHHRVSPASGLFWLGFAEAGIDLFQIRGSAAGIKFQASGYAAKRAFAYEQTTRHWTASETETQQIRPEASRLQKLDFGAGLFWRF